MGKLHLSTISFGLFLIIFIPSVSFGQVSVALDIPVSKALLYEPVLAHVVVRHDIGRTLSFGTEAGNAKFHFDIQATGGELIKTFSVKPLLSDVQILSGETYSREIMLLGSSGFRLPGWYTIQAVVELNSRTYASRKCYLEVAPGFELLRKTAGIPGKKTVRTYILEYLHRKNTEDLYLRIEDEHSKLVCGIFNLGPILRVRKPLMKFDESGNVHVLFQTIGMSFVHTAFTPFGIQLFSKSIVKRDHNVRLQALPNGRVTVQEEQSLGKE